MIYDCFHLAHRPSIGTGRRLQSALSLIFGDRFTIFKAYKVIQLSRLVVRVLWLKRWQGAKTCTADRSFHHSGKRLGWGPSSADKEASSARVTLVLILTVEDAVHRLINVRPVSQETTVLMLQVRHPKPAQLDHRLDGRLSTKTHLDPTSTACEACVVSTSPEHTPSFDLLSRRLGDPRPNAAASGIVSVIRDRSSEATHGSDVFRLVVSDLGCKN